MLAPDAGGYTYVDPPGTVLGIEDVFTKIEAAQAIMSRSG